MRLFNTGDVVIYIPQHANGILTHKDCELGFVTSANASGAWCRFLLREKTDGPFLNKESVLNALRTKSNSELARNDCLIKVHGVIDENIISDVIKELYSA